MIIIISQDNAALAKVCALKCRQSKLKKSACKMQDKGCAGSKCEHMASAIKINGIVRII